MPREVFQNSINPQVEYTSFDYTWIMNSRWFLIPFLFTFIVLESVHSFPNTPVRSTYRGSFTFSVTADIREFAGSGSYNIPQYFRGPVEAISAKSTSAFMVSPGDIDPPADIRWSITQTFGTTYPWYPVVGNHEEETLADMEWLRNFDYGGVNPGPSGCPTTTYSFDYDEVHFVMLNEYCDTSGDDVTDGDVPDHLYNWLVEDLDDTSLNYIFVFGHEPAYPQPDADNGRLRHEDDSLNLHSVNRDRFWNLLKSERITAYICGHTHNFSAVMIDGVWQLDAGHARGLGDVGARSTFLLVHVDGPVVKFEAYRDDSNGGEYTLMHLGVLEGFKFHFPFVSKY
jgi:hypothetical protein